MELVQWVITTVIGVLTFFGGRVFEKHKLAQQNRLKLLEPIEQWVEQASRLIGIVGDELSAVSRGLPLPVMYGIEDRRQTAKTLGESKEKVLGILDSKALRTYGTRKLSSRLADLVLRLDVLIEREYLQAYYRLFDTLDKHQDAQPHMVALLAITSVANSMIQDVHACLAQLKTRYT